MGRETCPRHTFSDGRHQGRQLGQLVVDAERGERDADAALLEAGVQARHQLVNVGVVAAGQRRQRDLVVARRGVDGFGLLDQLVDRPEAQLVLEADRVAEAAAVRAAAHDLEVDAVVDDFRERHDGLQREIRRAEVRDDRLLDDVAGPRRDPSVGTVGPGE